MQKELLTIIDRRKERTFWDTLTNSPSLPLLFLALVSLDTYVLTPTMLTLLKCASLQRINLAREEVTSSAASL